MLVPKRRIYRVVIRVTGLWLQNCFFPIYKRTIDMSRELRREKTNKLKSKLVMHNNIMYMTLYR